MLQNVLTYIAAPFVLQVTSQLFDKLHLKFFEVIFQK